MTIDISNFSKSEAALVTDSSISATSPVVAAAGTRNRALRDWVAAKDFGAVGDGVTDDTTALTNALAALGASGRPKKLYLPDSYKFTGPLNVPANCWVEGGGEGSACTVQGNTYGFSFIGSHSGVRGLAISAAATQSGTGGGFDLTSAGSVITVENVLFGNGLRTGINAAPNTSSLGIYRFRHLRWDGVANSVYGILIGDGTHHVSDINIDDIIATASVSGSGGVSQAWVALNYADTVNMTDSTFYQGTIGLQILTTGTTTGTVCKGVVWDTMSSNGLQLSAYKDADFTDCHVQTSAAANIPALNIGASSGAAVGFKWNGGTIQNNLGYGVILSALSSHNTIVGAMVSDNNTSNAAFNDGIAIAGGCLHSKIIGCTSGNNVLLATGHQVNGISTTGTADYYVIANNDTPGNSGSGVADVATGTHKSVAGNI